MLSNLGTISMDQCNFSALYNYNKLKKGKDNKMNTLLGYIKEPISRLITCTLIFFESNQLLEPLLCDSADDEKLITNSKEDQQKRNNHKSSYAITENERNSKLPALVGGSQNSLHI